MAEVCVSLDDKYVCSTGEMLILVLFIEILVYIGLFGGVFWGLRRFFIKKYLEREDECAEDDSWPPQPPSF